ncbi:MAG: tripartite tricarboxylate transporter substrate binding protein [Burkholderiales bacterium]|nr:tripartite tricarboxylate transporter substrate binding protein [Burkholderiales bacterium]
MLAVFVSVAGVCFAQSYPNRPVRLIVASAPGGNIDLVARVVAEGLRAAMEQSIVVDNRAGASGILASELAARAKPDGYTLLVVATSHSTNLHLRSKLSYDTVKDFTPISQLGAACFAIAVHPSSEVKTIGQFIALAKSHKGQLSYATAGVGQANHLAMEWLKALGEFDVVHVPYTSMGAAATALMGRQVDVSILSLPAAIPAARAGRLRLLALTGAKRVAQLPDIPTVAESGFPGYEVEGWQGLLAPAGTPQAIIDRLSQETIKVLNRPSAVAQLAAGGLDPVGSTPQEFGAFIQREIAKWGKVIKQAGVRAQ